MLDKDKAKSDTYRASTKPMSGAPQLVSVASATEVDPLDLMRLAENLATDAEMIAKVRTSDEDIKRRRILSMHEAFRQLRREEVLSPR